MKRNSAKIRARFAALILPVMTITSCSYDTQSFECADAHNKNEIVSFTKKQDSAIYSSVEMRLCNKQGNISTYAEYPMGCKDIAEMSKTGGTILHFDDVVYTLDGYVYMVNDTYRLSYKCTKK